MKKKLLAIAACLLASSVMFGYTATITNNSDVGITIMAAGKNIVTVKPDQTVSQDLDMYTVYALSYQGEWAPQGIGTIQKYTQLLYQITPVAPANGLIPISVSISDNSANGTINNLTKNGQVISSGDFFSDHGGYSINLGEPDSIAISFDSASTSKAI